MPRVWLVGPKGQRQLKKPCLEQMHEAFQFPAWGSVRRMGEDQGRKGEHLLSTGSPQPQRAQLPEQRKQRALAICGSGSLGVAVKRSAT